MSDPGFILEHRASIILYNLLKSRADDRPFLIPANVCPVVPATFLKARVPFEFVDIELTTFSMDLDLAQEALTNRPGGYGGVLYVRNFGIVSEHGSKGLEIIKDGFADLLVIDDRCVGWPEFSAEGTGDIVLYSTGYSKPAELGWGGFAYLLNPEVEYGRHPLDYQPSCHERLLDAFRTAIDRQEAFVYEDSDWLGDTGWATLPTEYARLVEEKKAAAKAHKDAINKVYFENLPRDLCMPEGSHDWRFQIVSPAKERILQAIFADGLFASGHYATLSHLFSNAACPSSRHYEARIVNLFNDFRFDEAMASRVAEIIRRVT